MGLFQDAYAIGTEAADRIRSGGGSTTDRREAVSRVGRSLGRNQRSVERVSTPRNEIEKHWNMYQTVPLVRASLNQFRDDVMASGYRMEADYESAESYLQSWADTGGTMNAQRDRDLYAVLREIPVQTLARGTTILAKDPAESDEDMTAGVSFINPKTVTPYRTSDKDMLLRPDDTEYDGVKLTEDGKAAAFVQHDRGHDGDPDPERRLTLDDVIVIPHDADPHDVFGTSVIEPVAPRIERVVEQLQDTDRAIAAAGWGQWFVGFGHEKVTNEDGSETIVEWEDKDMDDFMDDLENVEPGDIEGHDGTIEVKNIPGEVPDLVNHLKYETHYILTAMPAPTYAIGFESDINQFVVDGQEERHEQRVNHFVNKTERSLRPLVRQVLRQGGKRADGARLKLEPPEEDSPILSLTDSEVEKMERFATAFESVSSAEARTLLPDEVIRRDILQIEGVGGEDGDGGFDPDALDMSTLGGSEDFEAIRQGATGADGGAGE